MVEFDNWLSSSTHYGAIPTDTAATRAVAAWNRILDKPTSVVLKPMSGADLTAQTVRIEYDDTVTESLSSAGRAPVRALTIFGVRDHPTVADTVIEEGYRFVQGEDEYSIRDVIYTIGEVQARAEAVG